MGLMSDEERLLKLQRQLTVAVLIAALGYLLLQIGGFFADLLRILAISFLLSYLVINLVDFFDRWLRNRAFSVALVYVMLVLLLAVAAFWVIPAIVFQIASLVTATINNLPQFLQNLNNALIPLQERFRASQIDIRVIDILTNFVDQLPKPDPGIFIARVTDMAMSTMTWAVYSISIAVVTFYFLMDGHRIKDRVINLFPAQHRPGLQSIAHEMDRSLQAFFKGQLVLGCLFGLVMLAVYFALGVQYALLLSAFLAVCEVLPVIGPPIGFAPAVVAVAIHGSVLPGARFVQIIVLMAIFMVLQQVKDSIVAPRYMGNVIGMHPVMIFVAIMVGAKVDGMLGVILSLPVACVLNVFITHIGLLTHPGEFDGEHPVQSTVATSPDRTIGGSSDL